MKLGALLKGEIFNKGQGGRGGFVVRHFSNGFLESYKNLMKSPKYSMSIGLLFFGFCDCL
jgi:hypothetical protein